MMTRPGIWRHYKGDTYIVLGVVSNATNDAGYERMVLYHSVSHGPSDLHVRRESEFHEQVEVTSSDGKVTCMPRFRPIEVTA